MVALSRGVAFASARVVVVAVGDCGSALIGALVRMGIADVQRADCLDVARAQCASGEVDACLVLLPPAVPDEVPAWTASSEAPGRGQVPALLLTDALTHHVTSAARFAGYAAVAPARLPPRMLYRCISGLLQIARESGSRGSSGRRQPRPPRTFRNAATLVGEGTRKPRLQ